MGVMSLAQSFGRLRVALQAALGTCGEQASEACILPNPNSLGSNRPVADRLVRAVISDIQLTEAGRQVRFDLACQPGLEIRGDPLRFQSVVAGLVGHAIAQAPRGRVLVTCAHRAGRLQVAVVDDGIGTDRRMQESELRPIWEQLALQGGSLEVTSRRGEGSTVLAYWPDVRNERSESLANADTAERMRPEGRQDGRPIKSLVDQSH